MNMKMNQLTKMQTKIMLKTRMYPKLTNCAKERMIGSWNYKRKKNSAALSKGMSILDKHDAEKLNEMNLTANSKTPQHHVHDLANQLIVLNRLHDLHQLILLSKCMLSAYSLLTKDHRGKI